MVERTGLTRTELARRAGVSPSTISKFENDVENIAQLENLTVEKLSNASGVSFHTFDIDDGPRGLREPEALPFEGEKSDLLGAISAFKHGRNGVDAWVLRSSALEREGYLPGDVLIVDLNAKPEDGDLVCAQVYDRLGRAETQFRIYRRPFLTAPKERPQFVDDDRVIIRGVVLWTLRGRAAA